MARPRELEKTRRQLLAVLYERLSELLDDELRQANRKATNWEKAEGDLCPRCSRPSLRFKDGVCLPCGADLVESADRKERLRQRFLRFRKAHNARIDRNKKRGLARARPPERATGSGDG